MRSASIRVLALLASLAGPPAAVAEAPALPTFHEREPNQTDHQEFPYWSRPNTIAGRGVFVNPSDTIPVAGTASSLSIGLDYKGTVHAVWEREGWMRAEFSTPMTLTRRAPPAAFQKPS